MCFSFLLLFSNHFPFVLSKSFKLSQEITYLINWLFSDAMKWLMGGIRLLFCLFYFEDVHFIHGLKKRVESTVGRERKNAYRSDY
jgi:hypothetical protein